MPGQVTDGTQRHSLTVAVSRPWRGLKGSAAPGLPGRQKDTRTMRGCQIIGLADAIDISGSSRMTYFPRISNIKL